MEHIVCQTCHSPIPATLYDEHIKTHPQPQLEIIVTKSDGQEVKVDLNSADTFQSDNIENPQDIPQCDGCIHKGEHGHVGSTCMDCEHSDNIYSRPISPENSKEEIVHGEVVESIPDSAIEKQADIRDDKGRFVQGVSGNPHGRPKREWTWATLIEDYADRKRKVKNKDTGEVSEYSYRELVVKRLFDEAANGNMRAITEVFDRMDGKPVQEQNMNLSKDAKILVVRE